MGGGALFRQNSSRRSREELGAKDDEILLMNME